jgi:exodeoxyribonuclease VII large subunit
MSGSTGTSSSPKPDVLTVSQLNRRAKSLLEGHFDFVWVSGEISNLATPGSGHWYFTLKDGTAQVRCAMFRNRNQRLRFTPDQGDEVRIRCRVSLYEGRGEFQLIVEHMELAGEGLLQAAFEKLKARLQQEGLFDPERKRPLPASVATLGVVTSPTGAAIHDILTVLARRSPGTVVVLIPVQVQGEVAAAQIATAIALANRAAEQGLCSLDALIVGRGGGSLEDLWAFNEEVVARAIAASHIPVISAVGHEVDFSIADFVADLRAATPSAAAELLSTDQQESYQILEGLEYALRHAVRRRLAKEQVSLAHLKSRLRHPGAMLREQAQRADDLEQRLLLAQGHRLAHHRSELKWLASRLQARNPLPGIMQRQRQNQDIQRQLHRSMQRRLLSAKQALMGLAGVLDSLSPLAVLGRGYAMVTDQQGHVVTRSKDVDIGDELTARLAQGRLGVQVVRKDEPSKTNLEDDSGN